MNKYGLILLFAIACVSCVEYKKYYIPEVNLYVTLENNFFSKYGYIYLSHKKQFDYKCQANIMVKRGNNTSLFINRKDKNKIYISYSSYNVKSYNQCDFKIIISDKNSYSRFYENPDTTDPKILKDNFLEISTSESLDGIWVKKEHETSYREEKER